MLAVGALAGGLAGAAAVVVAAGGVVVVSVVHVVPNILSVKNNR